VSSGKPILFIGILLNMENEERTPFGRRLFQARTDAGITQEAAAKAVGMKSQSTLAEAETTGKRSGFTTQLAELYKVSASWLATGSGSMRPSTQPSIATAHSAQSQTPISAPQSPLMIAATRLDRAQHIPDAVKASITDLIKTLLNTKT
jgi:transcriptional regulator with XRE-family HTH domain